MTISTTAGFGAGVVSHAAAIRAPQANRYRGIEGICTPEQDGWASMGRSICNHHDIGLGLLKAPVESTRKEGLFATVVNGPAACREFSDIRVDQGRNDSVFPAENICEGLTFLALSESRKEELLLIRLVAPTGVLRFCIKQEEARILILGRPNA